MSDQTLIRCEGLRFAWRVEPILDGLNWHWQRGQHWAVLGGNGSGKSTLAALLLDRIRPNAGRIEYHPAITEQRIELVAFEEHAKLMARDQRLDDSETRDDAFDAGTLVIDYLQSAYVRAKAHYADKAAFQQRLQELIQHWQIEALLKQGLRYISTGQSRRVLLVHALLCKPKLLILDNPGDGLDADSQRQLNADISALCQREGQREHRSEDQNNSDSHEMAVLLLVKQRREIPAGITHLLKLEQGRSAFQGPLDQAPESQAKSERGKAIPEYRTESKATNAAIPLVDISGAQVRFQDKIVLSDVHWRLLHGQHTVISGPNGAGKTTLLNLLYGANDKAWAQPVSLFGKPRGSGESLADIRSHFGWVNTQQQLTYMNRTPCLEVLCSGFEDTLGGSAQINDRHQIIARQWLNWLDMASLSNTHFGRLSFGQQRLLLIVRAAIKQPEILVLDEPYLGLDEEHRQQAMSLVNALVAAGNSTVLFVSHHREDWPTGLQQQLALEPHPGGGYTTVTMPLVEGRSGQA